MGRRKEKRSPVRDGSYREHERARGQIGQYGGELVRLADGDAARENDEGGSLGDISGVPRKGARRVVGYSLGAFLLLEASARGEFFCEDVSLCAPFLAFPREAGAGGRVSATQVKFLRRWLKKDAPAALADFYARAGLLFPPPASLPYCIEDLDAGLEILAAAGLGDVPAGARSWKVFLGEDDALIDARAVAATFPENPVRLVSSATHDLRSLLGAVASAGALS